ncbi:MAG: glutathione S-transferase family protein [Kiloniellaceae bacterium]
MKVLGRSTSGNVQKVLFLLEELGSDYTREDYGRQFGNTGDAAYLAMNPTAKVPTLVDGDLSIWESNTILRYIATKAGSPLYPTDAAARSHVERWMDWLLATLNGPYVGIFKATKGGGEVSEELLAEMNAALTILEGQLSGNDFVAGADFSVADICLAPIVHRCLGFPVERPRLPAVDAWHARMKDRPAFLKATA